MARAKIPPDPRGGHIRIYWDVSDSPAWRALSWAERGLWIAMRRKLLGVNNGNIEATLGTLRHAGFTSSATLAKGLRSLMTLGFIDKTRQGGIAYGLKVCNLYRFTDEAVFDQPKLEIKAMPASREWKRFESIAQARSALREAHAAAKTGKPKNKGKVQKLKQPRSVSEWKASVSDSIPEQEAASSIHKLKYGETSQKPRKAA